MVPSTPPIALSGAFVRDSVFRRNGVTGFPAPYFAFNYTLGGGALGVWGRLLVHNSSFEDNTAQVGGCSKLRFGFLGLHFTTRTSTTPHHITHPLH